MSRPPRQESSLGRAAVPDSTPPRWLPVDTILGPDEMRTTDAALLPLAAEARRIQRLTILSGSLLLVSPAVIAHLSGASGGWVAAVAGTAAVVFGGLFLFRQRKLWDGDVRWISWYGRPIPDPDLPESSRALLAVLRSGTRRVRHRRGQSDAPQELPFLLLRGPFGPLILSSDPEVQGLALWIRGSGDRRSVEFEAAYAVATDPIDRTANRAISEAKPASLVPSTSASDALLAGRMDSGSLSSRFNRFLLLDHEALEAILRQAFPDHFHEDSEPRPRHRSTVIVRAFLIAQECLERHPYRTVKHLREAVVSRLRAEEIDHYGLSEDEDKVSESWMEKAFAGRGYHAIQRELLAAESMLAQR